MGTPAKDKKGSMLRGGGKFAKPHSTYLYYAGPIKLVGHSGPRVLSFVEDAAPTGCEV